MDLFYALDAFYVFHLPHSPFPPQPYPSPLLPLLKIFFFLKPPVEGIPQGEGGRTLEGGGRPVVGGDGWEGPMRRMRGMHRTGIDTEAVAVYRQRWLGRKTCRNFLTRALLALGKTSQDFLTGRVLRAWSPEARGPAQPRLADFAYCVRRRPEVRVEGETGGFQPVFRADRSGRGLVTFLGAGVLNSDHGTPYLRGRAARPRAIPPIEESDMTRSSKAATESAPIQAWLDAEFDNATVENMLHDSGIAAHGEGVTIDRITFPDTFEFDVKNGGSRTDSFTFRFLDAFTAPETGVAMIREFITTGVQKALVNATRDVGGGKDVDVAKRGELRLEKVTTLHGCVFGRATMSEVLSKARDIVARDWPKGFGKKASYKTEADLVTHVAGQKAAGLASAASITDATVVAGLRDSTAVQSDARAFIDAALTRARELIEAESKAVRSDDAMSAEDAKALVESILAGASS